MPPASTCTRLARVSQDVRSQLADQLLHIAAPVWDSTRALGFPANL